MNVYCSVTILATELLVSGLPIDEQTYTQLLSIFAVSLSCPIYLQLVLTGIKGFLLTRCYTQHVLRPFIDSKINHKRHFIKIPFINKRIEFIDLPSIFKDRSVTSSIPAYFQNSEPPIICYKITSPLETLYLISINLFLILTFMQTLLSHEIVKIPNLFILQPVI